MAVGLSRVGIDFNGADGQSAHMIFLLLAPHIDDGVQLDVLTEITHLLRDTTTREKMLEVSNYTEFLALMKTEVSGRTWLNVLLARAPVSLDLSRGSFG